MTSDSTFAGQRAKLAGLSIQTLVDRAEATVKEVSSNSLVVEYDGGCNFLLELMRADFNGDGIQDLLIHRGFRRIGGTYRAGEALALTRSPDRLKGG